MVNKVGRSENIHSSPKTEKNHSLKESANRVGKIGKIVFGASGEKSQGANLSGREFKIKTH